MSLALSAPSDVRSHPQRSLKCFLVIGLSIEYPRPSVTQRAIRCAQLLLARAQAGPLVVTCLPCLLPLQPALSTWQVQVPYMLVPLPLRVINIASARLTIAATATTLLGPLLPPSALQVPSAGGRQKELLCVVCSSFAQLGGGWGQNEKTP